MIGAVMLVAVTAASAVGREARGSGLSCAAGGGLSRGPCEFLDSVNVLASARGEVVSLAANFGLIRSDPAGLRFVCEEALGGLATGLRMAPDGTVFVAGTLGVFRHAQTCMPEPSAGDLRGRAVLDLAFDPDTPRMYALALAPRAVHVSMDGGRSFAAGWRFAEAEEVLKLAVAPSRPATVYAVGDRPDGRLLVLRSDDSGATFAAVAPGPAYAEGLPLDLLGVHPADHLTLFAALRASNGADQVWRSPDGGRTWSRLLALPTRETLGGFAFGATAETLFVAAREQFFQPGAPPAQLYRSSDGGQSWTARASGQRGPRYRCLSRRNGVLYACGGGSPNGDDFLLGQSRDEGATWTPLMTAEALAGPEACHRSACVATEEWLCAAYGLCETDAGMGTRGDGGETVAGSEGGCSCTTVGPGSRAPSLAAVLVLALLLVRRRSWLVTLLRRRSWPVSVLWRR
jgi:MYXO-CTERM domain-containing protein